MKNLNIYVISSEEYILSRERLVGKNCDNCKNNICIIRGKECEKVRNCFGWENRELQKKAVFLNNYDISSLQSIPDIDESILTELEYGIQKSRLLKSGIRINIINK